MLSEIYVSKSAFSENFSQLVLFRERNISPDQQFWLFWLHSGWNISIDSRQDIIFIVFTLGAICKIVLVLVLFSLAFIDRGSFSFSNLIEVWLIFALNPIDVGFELLLAHNFIDLTLNSVFGSVVRGIFEFLNEIVKVGG